MKNHFKTAALIICIFAGLSIQQVRGQSIKLFFGDLLNGAVTGAALGGATMALQNSDEFGSLRVGVGAGILYGAGVALYDYSILPKGQPFYITGTFNDGKNSSILVLLDTAYGAAGGALLGMAVALVGNNRIVDGLQYGVGAGAWIGFGFGLIDAFVLAEGPDDFAAAMAPDPNHAPGLIQYSPAADNVNIAFLNPTLMVQPMMNRGLVQSHYSMGIDFVNINIGL